MDATPADGLPPDDPALLQRRINALEVRIAALEARQATAAEVLPGGRDVRAAADDSLAPPAVVAPPPPPYVARPAAPAPHGAAAPHGPATGYAWSSYPSTTGQAPRASRPAGTPAAPRLTLRELEERFAGRLLAWTGGLALVAAAIFFLSLAFTRGWIGVEARVLIGLAAGVAAFVAGSWLLLRANALMGHVLTAIGLGVFTITVMAATRLYGLIPAEAGLALALLASVAAAVIAVRADARAVAAFGLVAALVAPPLLGAAPTTLTLAFVAVILVGTTAIALFRSWSWLPAIAFVLAAPQLGSWLLDAAAIPALVALAGFWLLNVVAAAGEEARIRRDDLRPAAATLVLADALFLAWGLAIVLDGSLEPWRGTAFVVAAALHAAVGGWFLARQGSEHRFGNLVAGIAAAFIALAAIAQLDADVVAAAWALEGLVLVWVAVRLEHRYAAGAAAVLGVLAIGHLVLVAYPVTDPGLLPGAPFRHPAAISLVVVTGSLLAAAWLIPHRTVRSGLAAIAILAAAWAAPYELSGTLLLAWLAGLAVAGAGLQAVARRLPERPVAFMLARGFAWPVATGPAELAGAVCWLAAAAVALTGLLAPALLSGSRAVPPIPFSDEAAIQGGLLVLAAVACASLANWWQTRCTWLLAGLAAAAWVVPFEVLADFAVVLWSGLAALAWLVAMREEEQGRPALEVAAVALGALAVSVLLAVVAPPSRLIVHPDPLGQPALLPAWPLSFTAVAALLLGGARVARPDRVRTLLALGAAAIATYGASVGVVAAFQAQVGGSVPAEELAKQAQVALSVLWTALGLTALIAGLVARRVLVRDAGLALLGLATAKVFLVDLAALDVAYRVLSLAALGLLLLVGAWLFTHYRGGSRPDASGSREEPVGRA
ncbi:MAG TPA: DUF2339 domain-containing protein [Candidatus Limnocylindrales bacterium]|nr:DUF2339 domain-containing protein [Candidatus Limnocylindrales bacterium]